MSFSVPTVTRMWAEKQSIPLKYWASIESTNTQAKNDSLNEPFILYLTSHQTGGRGRGTNTWTDANEPSSHFLLSSWCFRMDKNPQPIASPLMGLALYQAASRVWPKLHWSLKAPNDLYLEGKKVAGLLVETVKMGREVRIVIGLGMNVFSHPPVELAGSIAEFYPEVNEEEWHRFLTAWLKELHRTKSQWAESVMNHSACRDLMTALNRWPLLPEKIERVDPSGSLQTPSRIYSWFDL
ncbi:MAG: biotin--[acetyl-CoA-carboxylase] ligase [Bdellovibrionales bacterium]